jgi:hypothetical protein
LLLLHLHILSIYEPVQINSKIASYGIQTINKNVIITMAAASGTTFAEPSSKTMEGQTSATAA